MLSENWNQFNSHIKVLDIYATSIDYTPDAETSKKSKQHNNSKSEKEPSNPSPRKYGH